ncbi:YhgE/Pip domain-containing protein [Heyndrickxia acidiproducens]|uniref:YhgE/Pip domain-containing protein n=1 Tax=Heyndrickxia acidiproducens TaxID=1121084 RepID=UPI000369A211|nr:YhgE/Pip domain-containing protein [Heyndrickxia acidiproducens]
MNGFTLIHKEFMQVIKSPKFLIPVIAVILAPVLYAGMFIWAFKDPYARMDKVPVAVINQDTGAKMNGETFTIGKDLEKNLKKSDGFEFHFVSEQEAMDGLDNQKYYMVVKIPENFSENATTLLDKKPKKLQLQYIPNDSTNFLASQVGGSGMLKVKDKLSAEVSKTYAETIFEKATEMANGFKTASNGAKKLNNGTVQLGDGVSVLRKGANKLYDGQIALNTGITKVDKGAKDLHKGTLTLHNGTLTLNNGIVQANNGAGKLNNGAGQLYTGAVSLNSGAGQVNSGAQALKANLEKLARSSITFSNGLSDAKSGADQLASGTTVLSKGINTLATTGSQQLLDNATKLQKGAKTVADGSADLQEGLNTAKNKIPTQLLGGTQKLQTGVNEMKSKLPIAIASQVSQQLENDTIPQLVEKIADQMARQIVANQQKQAEDLSNSLKKAGLSDSKIQTVLAENATDKDKLKKEIADTINQNLSQNKSELLKPGEIAREIANGTDSQPGTDAAFDQLSARINQLNAGIRGISETDQMKQLFAGTDKLAKGAAALSQGEDAYVTALQTNLIPKLNQLNQGAKTVQSGSSQLASGLETLNSGGSQMTQGADQLADGSAKLADGTSQLQSGSAKLADGSKDLKNGAGQLSNGTAKLANGSGQLVNGSSKLADGTNTLTSGTGQLANGSNQLVSGTQQLSKGSGDLSDGTNKLKNGTNELKNKLGDAAKTAGAVQANNNTYNMMADPVSLKTNHYHRVPNYGTGFTPYFLSLGLFVGALLITIVYPLVESAGVPKSGLVWFTSKISILAGVGILQALVADVIILNVVGIHVKSVPLFVLFSVITSLTFITLIQFLVTTMQNPGRFLAIVILILQLTSSAGTFPLETVPEFIQAFNPLLPMTYTVKGFKAVISSGEYGVMWQNAGILLIYILAASLLTLLYFVTHYHRQYKQMYEHGVTE